jgi:hypothetical protein
MPIPCKLSTTCLCAVGVISCRSGLLSKSGRTVREQRIAMFLQGNILDLYKVAYYYSYIGYGHQLCCCFDIHHRGSPRPPTHTDRTPDSVPTPAIRSILTPHHPDGLNHVTHLPRQQNSVLPHGPVHPLLFHLFRGQHADLNRFCPQGMGWLDQGMSGLSDK